MTTVIERRFHTLWEQLQDYLSYASNGRGRLG